MAGRQRDDRVVGIPTEPVAYAAAGVAYVVAAIHLFHPTHGFGRLILLVTSRPELLLTDPRPIAFVGTAIAIIVAVPLVPLGAPKKLIYGLGAALMAAYVAGYLAWHLTGHGGFLPGREPVYHGLRPTEAITVHLSSDPWAAAAIVAEVVLLAMLAMLYSRE